MSSRFALPRAWVRSLLLGMLALCGAPACSDGAPAAPEAADSGPPLHAARDSGAPVDAPSEDAPAGAPADADAPDAHDAGPAALRVLFIGDSYTYVNDLPGTLSKIAATAGAPPSIATDEFVIGGATLEDLWDAGAPAKVMGGGYTDVVLQGQSVEPLFSGSETTFPQYALQFGELALNAGARPTFFATWARAPGDSAYAPLPYGSYVSPAQMQDELTIAYAQAARALPGSILVCVGEAFQRTYAQYPGIVLQQSDLSHPTVAGTYLAAATFYVALTGNPVPAESEVPAGISAADAVHLREIARVGTACTGIQLKGAIQSNLAVTSDGGSPFDFGTAGLPITSQFTLLNSGGMTVDVSDGMTLASPFMWTLGGAYPGMSGAGACGPTLVPGDSCTISLTYAPGSTATGALTLDYTSSYFPSVSYPLRGTATSRGLLSLGDWAGLFPCTDATCSPYAVTSDPGVTQTFQLFVLNRGAQPVIAVDGGAPLAPPFAWTGGAFPGGAGTVVLGNPAATYPYCVAPLAPGEQCVLSVDFTPAALGTFNGAVSVAYADSDGAVTPNASREVQGTCRNPLPP